ncbi:hypothetical protein BCO37747_04806 [Burkholderia contaminans]|jgi:hypothetical protein|nr:hypothetical protein BCO37747_04806 [Burkholderia contaminans]
MTKGLGGVGVLVAIVFASPVHAAPARCSSGYQDNTCLTPIWHDRVAPPMCPPGYTQTSAPRWVGSRWTNPGCQPPPPPPVTQPPATTCSDQGVMGMLIAWAQYYGSNWYAEGTVTATRHVCTDGSQTWSTLVGSAGLLLQGPTKAWHVPGVVGPSGMPVFAADIICYGPSHAFNGENGPQGDQVPSPPYATSPTAYGVVSDGSQCGNNTYVP